MLDVVGRSLSTVSSSQMLKNPDITEAHRLRGWYDSVGTSANYSEYRREGGGDTSASGLCLYISVDVCLVCHLEQQ